MADYFAVIDVQIDDMETYKNYMAKAKPVIEANGGAYLVRGGEFTVVEGEDFQPNRMVLLRFPSKEKFEAWYYSDDYQAARAIRLPVSRMTIVGVEGVGK